MVAREDPTPHGQATANSPTSGRGPIVSPVPPELRHAAAKRLVSQHTPDLDAAASRLLSAAPAHKIDLNLMWAVFEPPIPGSEHAQPPSPPSAPPPAIPGVGDAPPRPATSGTPRPGTVVRQVALLVPGTGRTAMTFVSEPLLPGDPGGPERALTDRIACVNAGAAWVASHRSVSIRILQGLPEPGEAWFTKTLEGASFITVGDLAYLRRPLVGRDAGVVGKDGGIDAPWPPGVRVDTFDHLPRETRDAVLIEAMTRTYEDTMDCPELCGLRETADVLESHRAAGRFDPAMWFIVYWHDQPHGCMLLNRAPESRSVELVYVGLSPELRGKGLASRLLRIGINRCRGAGDWLTCAVDRRNTPALWLYQRQGFLTVSERRAFVRPVPRG